jgi:hypothetical protein
LRPTNRHDQPVLAISARPYRVKHASPMKTLVCLTAYQPRVTVWFGANTASCDRTHLLALCDCQLHIDFISLSEIEMGLSQELLSPRKARASSSQLEPLPHTIHQLSWLPRLRNSFYLPSPGCELTLTVEQQPCQSITLRTVARHAFTHGSTTS